MDILEIEKSEADPSAIHTTDSKITPPKGEDIIVHKIPRYGDSVYYALSHQLLRARIGSAGHKTDTAALRAQLLRHVGQHQQKYHELLLRSVHAHGNRYAELQSDDDRLQEYLRDLDKFRFPPGDEVLQAVADVRAVDVVVLNADGQLGDVFESSSEDVSRSVGVMRTAVDVTGEFRMVRHHYDSVDHSIAVREVPHREAAVCTCRATQCCSSTLAKTEDLS